MWGDPVWSAELRGDPRMDLELALDLEHATICCTTWDIRVGWSRNLHIDSHKSYHRSQSYQNRNLGHTYYLQYIYISLVIARITWRWPPSNISVHSICYCRWSYQPHALQPSKKNQSSSTTWGGGFQGSWVVMIILSMNDHCSILLYSSCDNYGSILLHSSTARSQMK